MVINKIDVYSENGDIKKELEMKNLDYVEISAIKKINIDEVRQKIIELTPEDFERKIILSDLLSPKDIVLIVAPLDIEAPKGRLKLAQVQTIRDILDSNCSTITTFSILYARYKGNLKILIDGVKEIDNLKHSDKILIAEACTHHPIGDDIARVIIPGLISVKCQVFGFWCSLFVER